jgi:hypothetical protein
MSLENGPKAVDVILLDAGMPVEAVILLGVGTQVEVVILLVASLKPLKHVKPAKTKR